MDETKISPELEKRLAGLAPGSMVQAVIFLEVAEWNTGLSRRPTPSQRRKAVERLRNAAECVMPDIDKLLTRFGGRRLTNRVDALGSLPVETTPAGVRALAASERVKVILEDQPVSLLH